jgi:hypothetical protein
MAGSEKLLVGSKMQEVRTHIKAVEVLILAFANK